MSARLDYLSLPNSRVILVLDQLTQRELRYVQSGDGSTTEAGVIAGMLAFPFRVDIAGVDDCPPESTPSGPPAGANPPRLVMNTPDQAERVLTQPQFPFPI